VSRPGHCSKGAHPVPNAVYRSSCRDKHNRPRCDANQGPLTPQSDATATRLLRPVITKHGAETVPYYQSKRATMTQRVTLPDAGRFQQVGTVLVAIARTAAARRPHDCYEDAAHPLTSEHRVGYMFSLKFLITSPPIGERGML